LPKFLQPHAELLGVMNAREDAEDVENAHEGDDAVEDTPESHSSESDADARERRRALAEEHKTAGNAAFRAGRVAEAVESYSRACAFNRGDAFSRSNRSAAYAAMERWEDAVVDAVEAGRLKPGWAKAAMREATALGGAGRLTEAVEAWRRAVEMETEESVVVKYRKCLAEAEEAESRSLKEGKFSLYPAGKKARAADDDAGEMKKKKKTFAGALSFAEDE